MTEHSSPTGPMGLADLVDLASERVGGQVLAANDEFFAEKENLLRAKKPVFIDDKYTDRGKWMDGWETRRAFGRIPGHELDWCIVKLGLPGVVAGIDVDTSFFRGNYPEACSIDAAYAPGNPDVATVLSSAWRPLVPRTSLQGNSSNLIAVASPDATGRVVGAPVTHLRLNIFPDGGVARLRVYGSVVPDWTSIRRFGDVVDLAAVESGGVVLACNDMFFGSRHNLVMPGRSVNMGDGWETKRKRVLGHDWSIVGLGARASRVRVIEVDTNHFKGNCPESCAIDGVDDAGATVDSLVDPGRAWREVLPRTKLRPHTRHFFDAELADRAGLSHLRVRIFPDGGISRLRVHAEIGEGAP
jgi:allantoicase